MVADRFRFSLRTLMAVVAGLALSIAVLAKPGFTAASAVLSLTLLVLGIALIASITCGQARRSFWAGFAILGWGHLVIALGPWFVDHTGDFLISYVLLNYLSRSLGHTFIGVGDFWGEAFYMEGTAMTGYAYSCYLVIGQSLLSLILGYWGGLLGRWFHQRDSRH